MTQERLREIAERHAEKQRINESPHSHSNALLRDHNDRGELLALLRSIAIDPDGANPLMIAYRGTLACCLCLRAVVDGCVTDCPNRALEALRVELERGSGRPTDSEQPNCPVTAHHPSGGA